MLNAFSVSLIDPNQIPQTNAKATSISQITNQQNNLKPNKFTHRIVNF